MQPSGMTPERAWYLEDLEPDQPGLSQSSTFPIYVVLSIIQNKARRHFVKDTLPSAV